MSDKKYYLWLLPGLLLFGLALTLTLMFTFQPALAGSLAAKQIELNTGVAVVISLVMRLILKL